ncbi:uncharacterized protein LW93_12063 [Fusarium fujikuroi]|nr:uncharacterized protein LW93_12063 [Fusarium fujikuroi]SCV36814.1 uncharacterized protein FFB14_06265 [Fusarium fujikuroi]
MTPTSLISSLPRISLPFPFSLAIVAHRTGIPDTVIALLTAGAEREKLVVVIASLAQGRPSLAVGNIIGSAISNILGAFSLGLLFRPTGSHVEFDRVLDFLAICLLGYVLSHAAINITDAIGISYIVFGVVVLAIATTRPEKFIAVLSGNRGHVGILVANTVGSNVFLLSLFLGIVMVDTSGNFDGGNIDVPELFVLWGSTLAITITVWHGDKFDPSIGGVMLSAYIVLIVSEFTVIRHNADSLPLC